MKIKLLISSQAGGPLSFQDNFSMIFPNRKGTAICNSVSEVIWREFFESLNGYHNHNILPPARVSISFRLVSSIV